MQTASFTQRLGICWVLVCAAALAAWMGEARVPARASEASASEKTRIGVYDSRAIAIASRNHPIFKKSLQELYHQRDEARAAGDTQKVEQIEARGASLQTLRHLQAFANAPVTDLLVGIADDLPGIAKQADVIAIVAKPDYVRDGVELVDVTKAMVSAFHPDEQTLKIIADIPNHAPMDPVEVLGIKD